MTDDNTKSADARRTINVSKPYRAGDRSEPSGMNEEPLRDAATRKSVTGADLGQPQREHGAYGLVVDKDAGETPSADERTVRGVGTPSSLKVLR